MQYADNTVFCLLLSEMRLAFILVSWNLFAVTFYIISYYGVVSCFSHLINCSIVLKYLSFFDRAWQYLLIYFNTHRAKYLNIV